MLRRVRRRLRAIFRRGELERELDEELQFHLDREIELNRLHGMDEAEARRTALLRFGGLEQVKEGARDARGVRLVGDLWKDLRYGARMMRKTPGFTAVAVLSLALGVGANTALFSVIDAVLLSELPVPEPERLVVFEWESGAAFRPGGVRGYSFSPRGGRGSSSFHFHVFETLRRQPGALSHLFAFAPVGRASVLVDGQVDWADGDYVSGGYFAGLGVSPLLGRALTEEDDNPGAAPAAVISHDYWRTRFGGNPAVLGRKITINTVPFTIVGVAPRGFNGAGQVGTRPAFLVPIAFEPLLAPPTRSMMPGPPPRRGAMWLHLMGRLEPGATREQARDSLNGAFQARALELMPPPRRDNEPTRLEPKDYPFLVARSGSGGMTEARREYSATIRLLLGVVALILLIACANVANLLLARSAARASEITVRLAMGAGRGRLIRQLLTESLLVSTLGGVLGVGLAVGCQKALAGVALGRILPSTVEYALNVRVLAFTTALSVATGILFGLAPALRATRVDLTTAMKQGTRTAGGIARSRLSRALVVAQVAMSLVLLLGAGLFLRTVRNIERVAVGFNQERLLVFSVQPATVGYQGERLEQIYRSLSARLEALPGVRTATFCSIRLLSDTMSTARIILPGETARSANDHPANQQVVRANFFDAIEIPLLRGRRFTDQDRTGAPRVAIVSEAFERQYFGGRSALGQRVGFGEPGEVEIVGIARDSKYSSQRREAGPLIYTHWLQQMREVTQQPMSFALRTTGDPMTLVSSVRQAVRDIEPNLPVIRVTTQEAQARETFGPERFRANLLGFFGALAVLLAAIGLYGVMAYAVAQRTSEIGIRMALGAQASSVLRLVTWQGLRLALLGVVIGALAALALKSVIESQLFGVRAADPLTFGLVGGGLLAIALLACLIPARRATKVDPIIALRAD
jgi:predicted permease